MNREDFEKRFYSQSATAYLKTVLGDGVQRSTEEWIELGLSQGVRLQRFKRTGPLPRVRRVLGFLRGVLPQSVLDIGTGRGAFLWPLVDTFPSLPVHCIDLLEHRVELLQAVAAGGMNQLSARLGDVTEPIGSQQGEEGIAPDSFDVVTVLEVLEHLERPQLAIENCLRWSRRYVVASVPSKEDDNPEHVQLFPAGELERRFLDAGAASARCEHVLNHRLVFVSK